MPAGMHRVVPRPPTQTSAAPGLTPPPASLDDLRRAAALIEDSKTSQRWTLVAPDGRVWEETDPAKLLPALLQAMRP